MTIHIHNARSERMPLDNPRHVYVGRRMRFYPKLIPSPLANPFKLNKRRDNRDEVLESYRALLRLWLMPQPAREMADEFNRLVGLASTGDLHLYCWCAPESCHADVIKAEIEHRLEAAR